MELMSRFLYSYWLKVPDVVYMVLLFGGWIGLAVSAGGLFYGFVKKKVSRGWVIVLLACVLIVILTMTGKIAPDMAFNG